MDTSENGKLEFSFDYENYYNKLERLVAQFKIVKKELSYVFFLKNFQKIITCSSMNQDVAAFYNVRSHGVTFNRTF